MIIKKSALVFWAVIALCPPLISTADACTCAVSSGGNCSALTTADAVFEATVESIELRGSYFTPSTSVHVAALRDIKAWRGEPATSVITDVEGCGYTFHPGVRYLIVAQRSAAGVLSVSACGDTRELAEVIGAVEYLASLADPRGGTRVWGSVLMPGRPSRVDSFAPVARATVTIAGPASRTVITDAAGHFVAVGLPHGEYTVKASPAEGTRFIGSSEPEQFWLDRNQPRACAGPLTVVLPIDTAVSGVVTDESGKPPGSRVFMMITGISVPEGEAGGIGLETRRDGTFEFSGLSPGRYRLGLGFSSPSPGMPYTPASKASEVEIEVALGSRIKVPAFRIRRVSQITVRGTAVLPNGQPAADVELSAALITEWVRHETVSGPIKTDASGRFEFPAWEGFRYGIAYRSAEEYKFNPMRMMLDFIANGTPVAIHVPQR